MRATLEYMAWGRGDGNGENGEEEGGGELVGMGRRKNKQMLSSVANERYSSGTFLPTHIHIHTHTL